MTRNEFSLSLVLACLVQFAAVHIFKYVTLSTLTAKDVKDEEKFRYLGRLAEQQ